MTEPAPVPFADFWEARDAAKVEVADAFRAVDAVITAAQEAGLFNDGLPMSLATARQLAVSQAQSLDPVSFTAPLGPLPDLPL